MNGAPVSGSSVPASHKVVQLFFNSFQKYIFHELNSNPILRVGRLSFGQYFQKRGAHHLQKSFNARFQIFFRDGLNVSGKFLAVGNFYLGRDPGVNQPQASAVQNQNIGRVRVGMEKTLEQKRVKLKENGLSKKGAGVRRRSVGEIERF